MWTLSQDPNTEGSAISSAIASHSTTAGQVQGTPQLEGPITVSNAAVYLSPIVLDDQHPALNSTFSSINTATIEAINGATGAKGPAEVRDHKAAPYLIDGQSTGIQVPTATPPLDSDSDPAKGPMNLVKALHLLDSDPTGSHVPAATPPLKTDITASSTGITVGISKSLHSLPNVPQSSSTTLQPSGTKKSSNLTIPNDERVLVQGVSTESLSPGIDAHLGLVSGSQTSAVVYKSQYIFPSSHTLILDPTTTRGFDTSTSPQALLSSITHVLHDSSSTVSLLFRPSATPSISKEPSLSTISGQTITANSLGQYSFDNQTLTPGGVITISGSKISLAPNASDLIIGTSTEALGPSVSAYLGSGPSGKEVQKFTGNALGASDGLWSSSMMLLVSFLLLLWI